MIDHFNMVSMHGLDVLEAQGVEYPGLYASLSEAIEICKYQVLYNWYFAKIPVAPSSVELKIVDEEIVINDLISVSQDDVVHIHSIEPATVINPLVANENGIYDAPAGVDGYNPVFVAVAAPTPKYEEVEPDYHGLQSCYVTSTGGFNGQPGSDNCLTLYTITSGYYLLLLPEVFSNRFRGAKFSGMEYSDFESFINSTYDTYVTLIPDSPQRAVTGTGNDNMQIRYFFQGEDGVLAVFTSNVGVDISPILIRINSTE